jgi:hypothetical protein
MSAREAEASLTGDRETGVLVVVVQQRRRQWLRSDCGGSAAMAASNGAQRWGAAMAEKVAAQLWQWRRSNGFGGAATAMAMAAQQWGWQWWQRRRMSIALLSLRVAAMLLPRPPLFATDVRDVFCIFLLSLHIFNVGTPYRQTPDRHQTDTRQTDDI